MLAEGPLKGDDGNFYDSTFKVSTSAATYEYLTDAYGRTLYEFSHDKNGINTFTSATDTAQNAIWPIYQLNPVQNVPSILSTNLFSTINVFGQTQLTFKGWPLYYFGADEQTRGNTLGVSVPTPGTWPVVNQFSTAAPQ
jgi:predicted lipoprotein with Yx(FWY)xxD motif